MLKRILGAGSVSPGQTRAVRTPWGAGSQCEGVSSKIVRGANRWVDRVMSVD